MPSFDVGKSASNSVAAGRFIFHGATASQQRSDNSKKGVSYGQEHVNFLGGNRSATDVVLLLGWNNGQLASCSSRRIGRSIHRPVLPAECKFHLHTGARILPTGSGWQLYLLLLFRQPTYVGMCGRPRHLWLQHTEDLPGECIQDWQLRYRVFWASFRVCCALSGSMSITGASRGVVECSHRSWPGIGLEASKNNFQGEGGR